MMFMIFFSSMIIMSLMFLSIINPLPLGLNLLAQTVNMCIMIGLLSKSFWFSLILFLILLGGMLVLFMYVISLTPNEKFNFSLKIFSITMFFWMMILWSLLQDKMLFTYFLNNKEMINIDNMLSFMPENSLSLNKLYNPPTYLLTMILMIYLLIALITIVYITKKYFGPLRMFNKKK